MLEGSYDSHEAARTAISSELVNFYQEQYPEVAAQRAADVEQAAKALGDIYSWNVFPYMKVTWGSYPDHIGHKQSPGCFRCHDRRHRTAERERIPNECDTCHTLLAEDEENPAILQELTP